ncbi:MAG: hypothetical protein KJN76_02365, partial [Eudoraea sp.]|nr:hypothetical protein [Eudoraea sp.]
ASLGEEKEIPFLKMVVNKETNFMVKRKSLGAVNTISPDSVMPTHDIVAVPEYDPSEEVFDAATDVIPEKLQNESVPLKGSAIKDTSEDEVTLLNEEQVPGAMDKHIAATTEEIDLSEEAAIYINSEEEAIIHDSKATGMENKEDINFDKEDTPESLQNYDLEQFPSMNTNSEEAYWEAVLDPENEDETIFDICFMEELEEILSQTEAPPETWLPHEILPLDFLPVIENDFNEVSPTEAMKEDSLLQLEVDVETVHEDEKFAEELNRILKRIKDTDNSSNEDVVPGFIPLVVDEKDEENHPAVDEEVLLRPEEVIEEQEGTTDRVGEEQYIKLPWEDNGLLFQLELEQQAICDIALVYEEVSTSEPAETPIEEEEALFELNTILHERGSIFNELFRTCDADSKLILMDEILAVGDERDLKFLETLLIDEDERVRKKAVSIADQLKQHLDSNADDNLNNAGESDQDIKITESDSSQHYSDFQGGSLSGQAEHQGPAAADSSEIPISQDLFDIEFELHIGKSKSAETQATAEEESSQKAAVTNSFIGELLSIPAKLIEKLNG